MNALHALVLFAFPLLASTAAQACDPPFQFIFQNDISASVTGNPCVLGASTTVSSRSTAAAFIHYRRATPLTSVRYGFRINTAGLSTGSSLESFQVFAATSSTVAMSPATARVLSVQLDLGSSPPTIDFIAADANVPGNRRAFPVLPTTSTFTVRVEINVGHAGNGKYWINHGFSDPPDGVIESTPGGGLDNADLVGVSAAEIGMSNPTPHFIANHAGEIVQFDELESSDDVLFYDDFSSGAQ